MKLSEYMRSALGTKNLYKITVENKRILQELNWANIFNDSIKGCKWLEGQGFSPGRWAVGYPLLYILFKTLEIIRPLKIIEFGLGQTTNMLSRYSKANPEVQIYTLEHDLKWIDFFVRGENIYPENLKIIMVENIQSKFNEVETLSIRNLHEIIRNEKFDLIIVDAPFGSERYSRSQVISMVAKNIQADHFCIIIDDFDRQGEKETCGKLEEKFTIEGIKYFEGIYSGLKDCKIYCSEDMKYLISL